MIYRLIKQKDDRDIPLILSAYHLPSVSQFISIDESNYWQYVTTTENVYFYKVFEEDILVATTHCELTERILYMDIIVFPEHQQKGIATKILNDIQSEKLGLVFDKIQVSIDERNVVSRRLFENAGFVCTAQDEELLEYEYIKK